MAIKSKASNESITIIEIEQGVVDFYIVGTTPIILNSISAKVKHELLLPRGKKDAAAKAANLKHNPYEEFNDCVVKLEEGRETLIGFPATAFKGGMRNAAVDLPGSSKAQIGRLTYVPGDYIEVYGRPQLFMSVTRNSDMNHTPDVRTRPIMKEWCCKVSVIYTMPLIKQQAVVNLMSAAGIMQGIGDWRPEKGKGDYGQYKLVGRTDKDYKRISKLGREVQIQAMTDAEPYDNETEKLLRWFDTESKQRGFKVVA